MRRTHVDLFSGIGGFTLACEWAGVETIAFAEIDDYASRVLKRHWPNVRNYGDVRDVPAIESVWLVSGGVPCQPASVAGKRRGTADDRWLWPEALAVVDRIQPAWILFENPCGILSLNNGVEFERICAELEGQRYEVQSLIIPACAVGAPHRRNRVWIVAHSVNCRFGQLLQSERFTERSETSDFGRNGETWSVAHASRERIDGSGDTGTQRWTESTDHSQAMAHTNESRSQRRERGVVPECAGEQPTRAGGSSMAYAFNNGSHRETGNAPKSGSNGSNNGVLIGSDTWAVKPNVGRVADGIPKRVDRLRGLGNAIVPQVAHQLIKRMIEAEEQWQ